MEASLFVLIVLLSTVQSAIKENGGPKNALMKVDDRVVLTCETTGTGCDHVDWQKVEGPQSPKPIYQYGRGLLNPVNFDPQRYNISEINSCSLNITGLKINDSGRFICMHKPSNEAETTKSAVLVVVDVTASCVSNVTNNELVQGEGYYLECAINIPSKLLEPSEVTLSLKNSSGHSPKPVYSGDTSQPAVRTTISSTAARENVTARYCVASFSPVLNAGFDDTTASLKICSTADWTVYFPVGDIAILPLPPPEDGYHDKDTVYCTATGYPIPTFTWNHLNSTKTVYGSELKIEEGKPGEKYTCTARNIVRGKTHTVYTTITVTATPEPGCGGGCAGGIAVVVIIIICAGVGVVIFVLYKRGKNKEKEKSAAGQPLARRTSENSASKPGPEKPPRASSDVAPVNA